MRSIRQPRSIPGMPRLLVLISATCLALASSADVVHAVDCSDPTFISESAAKSLVASQFIAASPYQGQLIAYAYPVPIQNGQLIQPAETEDGGPSMTASGCAWLFYIDLEPETDFAHPTQFVLVGGTAAQPEISSSDELWWPTLDGIAIYDVAESTATSPDIFFGALPAEDPTCTPLYSRLGAVAGPASAQALKQWAIGFIGPDTWLNNWTQFKAALGTYAGVPAANADRWVFHDDNMKAAVKEANDSGAQRVWVFIACHGLNGSHKLQTTSDPDLAPADVAGILAGLDACSVYVVINACHSGNFRQPIIDALKARNRKLNSASPSTIAVLVSAADDKNSISDGNDEIGYFVKALIKGWGQSGVTTLEQAFDWAAGAGNTCADSKAGGPLKLVDTQACDPTPAQRSTWGQVKSHYR